MLKIKLILLLLPLTILASDQKSGGTVGEITEVYGNSVPALLPLAANPGDANLADFKSLKGVVVEAGEETKTPCGFEVAVAPADPSMSRLLFQFTYYAGEKVMKRVLSSGMNVAMLGQIKTEQSQDDATLESKTVQDMKGFIFLQGEDKPLMHVESYHSEMKMQQESQTLTRKIKIVINFNSNSADAVKCSFSREEDKYLISDLTENPEK